MSTASPSHLLLGRRFMVIYRRLLRRYGPQHWWPGDGAFETILGAILTQNTSWKNVEGALASLKAAGALRPDRLRALPQEGLARLIRSSGFFNVKARRLKAFAQYLGDRHGDDLDAFLRQDPAALRNELLGVHGIGPETADDILLYAAGAPFFVIDAYTKRILRRLGVAPAGDDYGTFQALFHDNLKQDVALFNEYHALLDRHAKEACRKQPLCQRCCLLDLCPTGKSGTGASGGG
ncbi:MAG: endonuclease III domain-containing protein [Chloroflexi bacterium]|nr:endonuclease III domain-containing protein [Chloroflexota bacterium]